VLDRHELDYDVEWTLGAKPFLTLRGRLVEAMRASIRAATGVEAELSTTGGTSDGRFIAEICPEVVELGPVNTSIHKIDEHVEIAALEPLMQIYRGVLEHLLRAE
jgi:succinyl-diaminopimelate desuccinylase